MYFFKESYAFKLDKANMPLYNKTHLCKFQMTYFRIRYGSGSFQNTNVLIAIMQMDRKKSIVNVLKPFHIHLI